MKFVSLLRKKQDESRDLSRGFCSNPEAEQRLYISHIKGLNETINTHLLNR